MLFLLGGKDVKNMQLSSDTKVATKRNRVSVSNSKDSKSEFSVTGTE